MSKFTDLGDRALDLVSQAGTGLRSAGHSVKDLVAPSANHLLKTGAALGAVKTGSRVAGSFVRRNPVVAVAAAAGVGLLAYAVYRKKKRDAAETPIEGNARRIEGRRRTGNAARRARATAGDSES